MAIERAALSIHVLPNPELVTLSLYAVLAESGNRPVRAIQRISAAILKENDAKLLQVPAGSASLNIERISYLESGKVIEFTRSIYRADAYEFVAELKLGESSEISGAVL
jgi:GntR family transcriptional regulator